MITLYARPKIKENNRIDRHINHWNVTDVFAIVLNRDQKRFFLTNFPTRTHIRPEKWTNEVKILFAFGSTLKIQQLIDVCVHNCHRVSPCHANHKNFNLYLITVCCANRNFQKRRNTDGTQTISRLKMCRQINSPFLLWQQRASDMHRKDI